MLRHLDVRPFSLSRLSLPQTMSALSTALLVGGNDVHNLLRAQQADRR